MNFSEWPNYYWPKLKQQVKKSQIAQMLLHILKYQPVKILTDLSFKILKIPLYKQVKQLQSILSLLMVEKLSPIIRTKNKRWILKVNFTIYYCSLFDFPSYCQTKVEDSIMALMCYLQLSQSAPIQWASNAQQCHSEHLMLNNHHSLLYLKHLQPSEKGNTNSRESSLVLKSTNPGKPFTFTYQIMYSICFFSNYFQ